MRLSRRWTSAFISPLMADMDYFSELGEGS